MTLCIVIPCHNEGRRLDTDEIISFVDRSPEVCVLLVNDVSTDNTSRLISDLEAKRPDQIVAIDRESVGGSKGAAVRLGVIRSLERFDCSFVAYLDADLATPFSEISRLLSAFAKEPERQLVMGARVKLFGRQIERKWYRHYLGRVFAMAVSNLTGLAIYDTQCGAKILRADLARKVFDRPFMTDWLFDIEMILRSIEVVGKERAEESIVEVPLHTWIDRGDSRLRFRDFATAPIALLRIWWRYR